MEILTAATALLLGLQAPEPDPPLCDRDRFPPREVAARAMQFNRAYRRHVEGRALWQTHRAEEWGQVKEEVEHLYRCWDWLHAAQGGQAGDACYWRQSLRRLRELIGDEAYYAGRMPPCVPVWRFQELGP